MSKFRAMVEALLCAFVTLSSIFFSFLVGYCKDNYVLKYYAIYYYGID